MGFVRRRWYEDRLSKILSFTAAPVLIINCFASFVLIKNPGFALKIASLERDVVRREFYRENPIRFVLFARSIVRKWGFNVRRRPYAFQSEVRSIRVNSRSLNIRFGF